ncbi:MAG: hypothetical protein GY718_05650 [Lentisphaerae bacterium]|nr:hypothetical protein [Lentisphaerota bacterium]
MKPEENSTIIMEGNACEFPLWSYSKQKASTKELQIDYPDGTYVTISAPKGLPGPQFPGYLDVLLANGYNHLFGQNFIEISIYEILKTLGKDPTIVLVI